MYASSESVASVTGVGSHSVERPVVRGFFTVDNVSIGESEVRTGHYLCMGIYAFNKKSIL